VCALNIQYLLGAIMYQLYIGNKNYSSWSLRSWLLMSHFQIPFEENVVPVAGIGMNQALRQYAVSGLVPCLHDGDFQVWDTLAIAEFLYEPHPDKGLYPTDKYARARARSISAEMHSGFGALRSAMPMNIKLPRLKGRPLTDAEAADVARIDEIFVTTRREFAGDKPYLFGDFSVADAMFSPVVWRLFTYNVHLSGEA
jgi:glutathione S-transferase